MLATSRCVDEMLDMSVYCSVSRTAHSAFDVVDQNILGMKLLGSCGFQWIASHFSVLKNRMYFAGAYSQPYGSPWKLSQGSVLVSLFFILFASNVRSAVCHSSIPQYEGFEGNRFYF